VRDSFPTSSQQSSIQPLGQNLIRGCAQESLLRRSPMPGQPDTIRRFPRERENFRILNVNR